MAPRDMTLGFQVDRVKHAEPGEGKVRLTAYYASTGKVQTHVELVLLYYIIKDH